MSYTLDLLVLYDRNKKKITDKIKKYLPEEQRDDIKNGYMPYDFDKAIVGLSKELKFVVMEVDGDYGHYFELWKNGKEIKLPKLRMIDCVYKVAKLNPLKKEK